MGRIPFTWDIAISKHGFSGLEMRVLHILVVISLYLAVGCSTSRITNLTPRQVPRNAEGLYLVEVAFKSNQRSIRRDSLKPMVILKSKPYPMKKVLLVDGRWETLIPVLGQETTVNYHFKIDYEFNDILVRRTDSKLSPPYQLQVLDHMPE